MLGRAVAVLAVANVLNNRVAPRLAPLTSAAATGLLVLMARRSGLSFADLGCHRAARGVRMGGALAAGVAAAYTLGVTLPATRRFFHDERALALPPARALEEALLQVPVGTVLLEEVGFRGVLYAEVARTHGAGAATAVSSALFGLWHVLPSLDMVEANPALGRLAAGEGLDDAGSQAPLPPVSAVERARVVAGGVVATTLAGVLFCTLRRHAGLAAPAMLHTATNSLGYLFARIAATGARRSRTGPARPTRS
jgi:membrane protease YdiL (CAAX protease family)